MKIIKGIFFITFLILLGCEASTPESLGNGFILDFNARGAKLSIISPKNVILVTSQVLGYGFDSNYVVAAQRPWDSIPECKSPEGETLQDCKEAFRKSDFSQYWIIEKKTEKIYGPYGLSKYVEIHRKLGIKAEIKMDHRYY